MVLKEPWFVGELANTDPQLYQLVERTIQLATGPGALDDKTKLLIALALDAYKGTPTGVRSLAEQARQAGAREAEIQETLRIAYLIAGMDCLHAGSQAFSKQGMTSTDCNGS
ncbi:MAG: carboxymuconolactone decarboxylase family protein [Syntrophomonadaceae bacterium]|nr:carboxymuconolactone decarboxylase family protein [Syntrophomonadaceae bacterium]